MYGLRDVPRLIDLLGDEIAQRLADAAERAVRDPLEAVPEASRSRSLQASTSNC